MGTVDLIGITLSAVTVISFGTMFFIVVRRAIKGKKSGPGKDKTSKQSATAVEHFADYVG